MAISISGITLYRPTASSEREFFKDNYGANVGVKDNVSITDQVTYQDGVNLIEFFDALLSFVKQSQLITINYGSGPVNARISGLEIDQDSDFVNKFSYTISFEAYPTDVPLISPWPLSAGAGVRELTYSESIEEPKDSFLVTLENSRRYWNKVPTFTFSIQLTCHSTDNTVKPRDKAIRAIRALKKIAPSDILNKSSGKNYGSYTPFITSCEESYSDDGSGSVSITVLLVPPGSSNDDVLIETNEETVNDFFGEKQYSTKQLRVTFRGLSNMTVEQSTEGVKEAATINIPFTHANSLLLYYLNEGNGTPEVDTPGNKNLPCPTNIPKLPPNNCYNTVSVGLEKNYSEGTATAIIEQSTEPTNCDGDGYVVDYNINRTKNQKTHAELFGWGISKAIVQDLQCEATESVDLSVNVSSQAKCLVSELKAKAEAKFDELKTEFEESGTMTKHNLSINSGRCSISATFIMSKGDPVIAV
jgi:hypothetical protein